MAAAAVVRVDVPTPTSPYVNRTLTFVHLEEAVGARFALSLLLAHGPGKGDYFAARDLELVIPLRLRVPDCVATATPDYEGQQGAAGYPREAAAYQRKFARGQTAPAALDVLGRDHLLVADRARHDDVVGESIG